jgi:3-oxoacyl-[acyl-carrier protein] reductase
MASREHPGATPAGPCEVARVAHPTPGYSVAIVTGGSRGTGREVARELADRGYAVVVVYLRDQGQAEATVEDILAADGAALAVRADVTDELDVARLFEETQAAFGDVDVVIHAATRSAAVVNREAARRLRRGGAIVNVAGSEDITSQLAGALRARNITVIGLAPRLEPSGAQDDVADLVALLDRWRRSPRR